VKNAGIVFILASLLAGSAAFGQTNLPVSVQAAITDLAGFINVQPDQITVVHLAEVTWPDPSLGCPEPGKAYAQVLVKGYKAILESVGRRFEYHTDMTSRAVRVAQAEVTPPTVAIPAVVPEVVGKAIADLSARLRVEASEIKTISFEDHLWLDGSLGLPDPGMVYTKAIVSGYLVILGAGDRQYAYHCSETAALLAGLHISADAKPSVLALNRTECLDGNNFFELVRIDPESGASEVVFPALSSFAVTPDGKSLAVIVRTSRSGHSLLLVDGEGASTEIDKAFEFGPISWSPLGDKLAYWKRPTIMAGMTSLEIYTPAVRSRYSITPKAEGEWHSGPMAWTLDGLLFNVNFEGQGPRALFWDGTETAVVGKDYTVMGWIPKTKSVLVKQEAQDGSVTLGALRVPGDAEIVPLMQASSIISAAAVVGQNAILAIATGANTPLALTRVTWGGSVAELMPVPGEDSGFVTVGPASRLVTLGYVGPEDSVVEVLQMGETLTPLTKLDACPVAWPIVN